MARGPSVGQQMHHYVNAPLQWRGVVIAVARSRGGPLIYIRTPCRVICEARARRDVRPAGAGGPLPAEMVQLHRRCPDCLTAAEGC